MAITGNDRGTGGNNSGATSITITPGSNLTAGSWAILCLAYDNQGTNGADPYSSISDSLGNTWTSRSPALYDPAGAGAGVALRIFSSDMSVGTLTTGDTITVSFGAVSVTAKAWTLSEIVPTTSFAIQFVGAGAGTGAATGTPTVTTASIPAGDIVVAAGGIERADAWTGDSDTTNGSWSTKQSTSFGTGNNGMAVISQRKIVTGTGTQTYDPTTTSADCILCWASFTEISTGATYTLTGQTGALTLTGNNGALKAGRKLNGNTGALTLTGNTGALTLTRRIAGQTGALILTGNDAALQAARKLVGQTGALTLTGNDGALTLTRKLTGQTGAITLTANDGALTLTRRLTGQTGALILTGNDGELTYSAIGGPTYTLTGQTGALTLTGNDAALIVARKLVGQTGALILAAGNATLTKGTAAPVDDYAGFYVYWPAPKKRRKFRKVKRRKLNVIEEIATEVADTFNVEPADVTPFIRDFMQRETRAKELQRQALQAQEEARKAREEATRLRAEEEARQRVKELIDEIGAMVKKDMIAKRKRMNMLIATALEWL